VDQERSEQLPLFYSLDESDPDIVILRRSSGGFVAAFSTRGATQRSFIEAAQEDYRQLLARALAGESGRRAPSIDELPEHVALLLDRSGTIMAVNTAWKRFAMEYPCHWPTERRWFVGRFLPLPQNGDQTGSADPLSRWLSVMFLRSWPWASIV
jgi:hypothetical protein